MKIFRLGDQLPKLTSAYIAPSATIIGDVHIEVGCSVWPGAVLRGDNDTITIGKGSNIQDGAILHADPRHPLFVGENVSVGHAAVLHGCRIGHGSLIGIHATILNDAVLGDNCIVGANALITERKRFPDRCLIVGSPAKVLRELTDEEIENVLRNAREYVEKSRMYMISLKQCNLSSNLSS